MCGNYSREETIQERKLYEEIRYIICYVTLPGSESGSGSGSGSQDKALLLTMGLYFKK